MSTPYVLKGWKTREWQNALELASAVDGNDPEMHLIGGTYVEVGRNAQGPYVEVNSGDANGRDLRVRRVYMKPKPSRTSKRKANGKIAQRHPSRDIASSVRVPPIDSWSVEHGDRKKRTHEDIYRWSSPITFVAYEAIVGINRHDDEYQVLRSKFPGVDGFVYIGPGGRPFDDREHESLRGMRAEVIAFDRKVAAGDGAARWLASEIENIKREMRRNEEISKKIKAHNLALAALKSASETFNQRLRDVEYAPGFTLGVEGAQSWKSKGKSYDSIGETITAKGRSGTEYTVHRRLSGDSTDVKIVADVPGRGRFDVPFFLPTGARWGGDHSIVQSLRLFEWDLNDMTGSASRGKHTFDLVSPISPSPMVSPTVVGKQQAFKFNGKLRRTKAACSRRGRETRQGKSTAASHLATHCPPLGVRKGNDASPKVRVLSMKKKTRTIRGVGFNSYDVNLMVGNQFVTIEADAYRRPVLPESIRDSATREAILHAVQHYRSGR